MDKKRNVPEIRFKGFEEEWEIEKGKNLFSISTGKSNTQDKVENGQYPFYVRSFIIEHSNKFLFDEEAVLTVGDGVGTGKVFHYVNGKYDLHQRVYRMFNFNEKINGLYFYYYFSNNFYNRVMAMSAKTSVDSVRYNMISEMSIELPKIKEQFKIANYLKNIDQKLEIERKKHQKLINFKKAMLENMFPKEGENVPKIRFSGFSDEWGVCELGELGEISSAGVDKKDRANERKIHLLNYMDVYNKKQPSKTNINTFMNTTASDQQIKTKDVLKGDIFFTPSSETSEDIGHSMAILYDIDGLLYSYHIMRFRPYKGILDIVFSNYFANIMPVRSQLIINCQGAQRMTLKMEEFDKLIVKFPNVEEQTLIGSFFQNLDKKIELLAKKIKKIEDFKKAMLEKMFV